MTCGVNISDTDRGTPI